MTANPGFAEMTEKFANQQVLQFAFRELLDVASAARLWMAFALTVALFALVGPFGTFQSLDLPGRLGYWLITLAVTWTIALFVIALSGVLLRRQPFGDIRAVLTGAAFASIPIAIVVELIGLGVFQRTLTAAGVASQVALTLPVSLILGLVCYLIVRPHDAPTETAAASSGILLLRRLKPENRGDLICLSMQDHYVNVVTEAGSELVLLRFADALDELGDADGLRIHRSHWVARPAVAGFTRSNGKLALQMSDGRDLPVSRTYAKSVKTAGLLEPRER